MAMLEAMQRADVDVVELQLPFSEPIADGPVFVRANQQALDAGMTWERYFHFMRRATSAFDMKILMMGYYNSVLQMGHETFCACLAEHGGSGFIIADLPPEEAGELFQHAETHHLSPIVLMTPTNSQERLHEIARHARGFIYCVARRGVTGKRTQLDDSLEAFMARCRQATPLPLSLGFGLRTGADLRRLHGLADMGTLGTILLNTWEQGGATQYARLLHELDEATR
jgi:tryptophan synthase alpha chain